MDRRQFVLYSGSLVLTLSGCLSRESTETADTTSNHTGQDNDQEQNEDNDQEQNKTMQQPDQYLELVNMDDKQYNVQITISSNDQDILDHTEDLSAGERQQLPMNINEPDTYEVSATVDEDAKEMVSIYFGDYALQQGSNIFVEIKDGHPDISWEE